MQIQIDFWQLLLSCAALITAFAAVTWAFGNVLAQQFKAGLDARFALQDEVRTQREKALDERFKRLEEDIEGAVPNHNERISALEAGVKKSPTHADMSGLHEKINAVSNDISKLSGEFLGVRNLLETLHRHLLNGGKQ